MPAILAVVATEGLNYFEKQPELFKTLAEYSKLMYENLVKGLAGTDIKIEGSINSPFLHLKFSKPNENRESDEKMLQEIVDLVI
jgi:hypothetical protein